MFSSALPHVIAFLTRPLVSVASPAAVTSAQLILNASLFAPSATFTLTATSKPPAALHAASIGSAIPWTTWFEALGNGRNVLVFYGPGYLKVRIGEEQVTDVWSEETQGSVIPISQIKSVPLLQQSTGARLRAALLSARVRSLRRTQQEEAKAAPLIRVPRLFIDISDDSGSESDDADSDSDYSSTLASDSGESVTSAGSSPPMSPAKPTSLAIPSAPQLLYRAPRPKTPRAFAPVVDRSEKQLTSYLYQGGVTRVMTGGVMLGPRPAAHVVAFKRS